MLSESETHSSVSRCIEILFERPATLGDVEPFLSRAANRGDDFEVLCRLLMTPEGVDQQLARAADLHLFAIHRARLLLVRLLLPAARVIIDLGGANAPLYRMGYPHSFDRLVMVDLPPGERHQDFREVSVERQDNGGEVVHRHADMTDLSWLPNSSVDLVWSGQSIEHVQERDADRMCKEAFRVLRPGGHFCLDTPNGIISSIHAATAGLRFIHADHKVEYSPTELENMLLNCGFEVVDKRGICGMPMTSTRGAFFYEDFFIGGAITADLDGSYIQFFHCIKPATLHEAS